MQRKSVVNDDMSVNYICVCVCMCLLQGPGCDCGIHRIQHLVYQALLQRHAHSNQVFVLNKPFRCCCCVFLLIRLLFSFLAAVTNVRWSFWDKLAFAIELESVSYYYNH